MGIYKKGKTWYIDYYVKGQRKRRKIGPSKKLAEQVLQDVHLKIAKGEYLGVYDERKIPFEDYAEQYLAYSKDNKARSTYVRRDKVSVAHLTAAFEGRYLFDITPRLIENYKAKRLEKVSPATVNRELACLKHMYNKAIEWGYVKTNPVKSVRLLKEPPGRLRYLRPEEVKKLLDACNGYLKSIVITALNTGMRKGEVLAQRFGDIKKGFSLALKRAKITDFHFHDLRHTFGSHLVMQGIDFKTVQQVMGHKNIKMTMRYSHLSPEYVQQAIERLDNVWTLYGTKLECSKKIFFVSNWKCELWAGSSVGRATD